MIAVQCTLPVYGVFQNYLLALCNILIYHVEEQPCPHTATTWAKILYDLGVPLTEHLFLAAI